MLFCALMLAGETFRNIEYPQGGFALADQSRVYYNGFALVDHVYKSFLADHLLFCYISWTAKPSCQSLNYNLADKTCELNNDTTLIQFSAKLFCKETSIRLRRESRLW